MLPVLSIIIILVKAVAGEMGIKFLGIGFQPKWGIKDILVMPKVNLDFSSEDDMIRKFRAGLAFQPVRKKLLSFEGKPNAYLSMRSQIWTDTDNNRTGMLPFVFDDSFGFLGDWSGLAFFKLFQHQLWSHIQGILGYYP
ncbi:glutamate--cysteine ligase, chloroplastic-like isoform X2 [Castanea sativa]|uniref:glutamate--cysteine ligase, chloroplastic-like isoform X2 n=1 Tax=Castanea sativa TaxID=21020 RepID=UPI003F64A9F0